MADFTYVTDSMRFSYSNLSSFDTCKYGWMLNYIEGKDSDSNFFAQFGLLVHEIFEKYWKKELDKDKLAEYYKKNYRKFVTDSPPLFPKGMGESYYKSGYEFFQNFSFDRDLYEIILIEGKAESSYNGTSIVVKPDLIVREKSTGDVILMDYKTSKPVKGDKWDTSKLDGYIKQLTLYKYFVEKEFGIKIDRIELLFIRINKIYVVEDSPQNTHEVMSWFEYTLKLIEMEREFKADPSNSYFCQNLCGVRRYCKYW